MGTGISESVGYFQLIIILYRSIANWEDLHLREKIPIFRKPEMCAG